MKKYFFNVFFCLLVGSLGSVALAQSIGIDYYKTGELEIAQSIFEKELTQNPGEANFYLGEIAYSKGDFNKAKSYYEAGMAASPEYVLNQVGLGKILLKSDTKAAENLFSQALKKNKKDVEVLVAVAEAYYKNGMTKKMDERMEDATKANKQSPLIYTFRGDMLKDANDIGGASGEYEQAVMFDPNYVVANIKLAQLYTSINASIAVERLNKVLEIRPDYDLAYKYLGNVYYRNGNYKRAIEAFDTFFKKGDYSTDDLTRYAASLFFDGRYDEASKLITEGIAKNPDSFVLNRLLMYSALEREDYAGGLTVADRFFSVNRGDNEYIARDYITYAKILTKNDQFDKAMQQYDLAIQLDPDQYEIYKEIAETLANSGETAKAGDYFKKYIQAAGEKTEALDYFNMGRYYYMAAGTAMKDTTNVEASEKMKHYLAEADSAFAVVSERIPESHLGFLFRARTNSLLDPTADLGLAKPYYEKTLEILLAKDDQASVRRELIEAYRYLSYYYYVQFDKDKSEDNKAKTLEYSNKLLEIDPANSTATQLVEALK